MKKTLGTGFCVLGVLAVLLVAQGASAAEKVLSFSGSDSYVDLGMPAVLQIPSGGPFTIEGWMYFNTLDTRDMLYAKNSARVASGYSFLVGFYDTGDMGAYSLASSWVKSSPETNIGTKRWYHAAFSYNGTNITFYLDGQAYGTRPFNYVNVTANTVKLGGYASNTDINGMKSDVRVWNHARTQQQITDGRSFRLVGNEAGLLGYWPLNDGSGTNVLDQTANASTGTLVNATWVEADDLELLPAGTPFLLADAFSLADIETGNPAYTISNVVDVTDFPVPAGYDLCQVTESGEATAIDTEAWVSTGSAPEQAAFTLPVSATNVILYAWFTNSSASVALRRARGEIAYVTDVSDSIVDFFAPASYVSLGNPGSLQLAANHPLTVEGWVRFKSLPEYTMLFCKNTATPRGTPYTYMFGLRSYGATLCAYTGAGGTPVNTWVDIPLATPLQTERWYHLAFCFDGTTLSGYVDGQKVGENDYSFGNTTAHAITIGGYTDATDPNALRSDVRFWDHARGPADIARYRDRRLSGMESGLLGYWPLNDWSGTAVYDQTAGNNHGALVKAMSTFSAGFALDPPPAGFALAPAFTLADIETASARFTNSNTVDVSTFPLPADCDLYQVTASGDPAVIDPGGWLSVGAPPAQLTFAQPSGDTAIVLYAWFTNSLASSTLLRSEGSIFYTEVLPAPSVRPTLTRERMPGSNVVIYASDVDFGSTGGEANGIVLDVVDRIALAADPADDLTPGAPYVTLAAEGDYPLLLWLKNEAGNTTISVATCLVSVVSYSGSNVWTGLGYSDLWSDGANWGAGVPGDGQEVIVNSGSLRLTAATAELDTFVLGVGATLTFEGWSSALRANELMIAGTVTHEAQTVTEPDPVTGEWVPQHRIWLQGSDLTVTATGSLNADYKGYMHGAGPGRAVRGGGYGSGGGGGYGGHGGDGYHAQKYGPACGEPQDPWQPGSGGGLYAATDGPAGGAIRIEMSGRVTVDGTVTARGKDGSSNHATAGSGGGIAITCDAFQGASTGLVRVDGGRGNFYGGTGGGGRIALHYNPASQAALELPRPAVRFSAHVWRSNSRGDEFTIKPQMGTLYLPDLTLLAESPTAAAVLDGQRFWYTRLVVGNSFTNWSPASLAVSNCVIGFPEGFELHVGENLVVAGPAAPLVGDSLVGAGLILYAAATNHLYGAQLQVGRDLTLGNKAWIYPHTEGYSVAIVGMRVGRDVSVAASGGIDANEKGFMPTSSNLNGPGAGLDYDSGGAYGGAGGGAKATPPYGLAALPLEPGSPGGWRSHGGGWTETGMGGGAIHLLAGGNLTIDGTLTANGGRGWYYRGPAGSGGAIFLSGLKVTGSGTLRADGGIGQDSRGPSGGGRIAVWHHMPLATAEKRIAEQNVSGLALSADIPSFSGTLQANVYTSILANQPKKGTTGFYTIAGTLVILR